MRNTLPILLPLALVGCGSVLDPAPYDPRVTSYVPVAQANGSSAVKVNAPACRADTPALDQFDTLPDAAACLESLAIGYATHRNAAAQQQTWFDLPIIGMGVAAVANPVFHGATAATAALGLGSATGAGVRLYFGPQLRATTYLTASQSLYCAYGVATKMAQLAANAAGSGQPIAAAQSALSAAIEANASAAATDTRTAVAVAAAQTAMKDLTTAAGTIAAAPAALQAFALATMAGATSKIATGTQDLGTVLGQIKAAQSPTTTASAGSAAAPAPHAFPQFVTGTSAASLPQLIAATDSAEVAAKAVSDAWATLSTCTAVYQ